MTGRAWVFGDGIDTDTLAPGIYLKLPAAEAARHCLEAVRPEFAAMAKPGDYLVAGRNFGLGSSREQAAVALKTLGIAAVLAQSAARIFYRNALNIGLPVLVFPAAAGIGDGDRLSVDALAGSIRNLTAGRDYQVKPIPAHLMAMISDGGLIPHLEKRFAAERAHGQS